MALMTRDGLDHAAIFILRYAPKEVSMRTIFIPLILLIPIIIIAFLLGRKSR